MLHGQKGLTRQSQFCHYVNASHPSILRPVSDEITSASVLMCGHCRAVSCMAVKMVHMCDHEPYKALLLTDSLRALDVTDFFFFPVALLFNEWHCWFHWNKLRGEESREFSSSDVQNCTLWFSITHACFAFFRAHWDRDDHTTGHMFSRLDVLEFWSNRPRTHDSHLWVVVQFWIRNRVDPLQRLTPRLAKSCRGTLLLPHRTAFSPVPLVADQCGVDVVRDLLVSGNHLQARRNINASCNFLDSYFFELDILLRLTSDGT